MILHSILLLAILAGQPPVSAEGFGDLKGALKVLGKKVSNNEKAPAPEDEDAREAAADKNSAAIGKALKKAGVDAGTVDSVHKTVGFSRRTSKAAERTRELTPAEERQIGRLASAEILGKYRSLDDEALNDYVQTVGQAVAMSSDRPQTFSGYHFQVLDSEEVNAISIPGGFIFVTKGMLRLVENEDELACVLAHEVSHVALGHGSEAIVKARRMQAGIAVAADASSTFDSEAGGKELAALRGDVKTVMDILMRTGYGHGKEFESDAKGALYAQRTGYDPAAMAAVLEKLAASKASQGGFLKTHPTPGKRARQLQTEALEPPAWYTASKTREMRFAAALSVLDASGK